MFNFTPKPENDPFDMSKIGTGNGSFAEPNADQRQMAASMREIHNAFTFAGFTDDQAFQLVKGLFLAGFQNYKG